MNKPVELMTEAEQAEYYKKRRAAILAGDSGILPDGRTCKEAREAYIEACNNDPFRTLQGTATMGDVAAAAIGGSDLPPESVASESPGAEQDESEIANKRCC